MLSMKINFGIETPEGFMPMNDAHPAVVRWLQMRYHSVRHLPKDGTVLVKQRLMIVGRKSNDREINITYKNI